MSTAIAIEHVSKAYRLGRIGAGTVHEDFGRWWAWVRGRPDPLSKVDDQPTERLHGDVFQALDDVSFTVGQGEVLGVIGRNGAGKSTLLKILSQVTAPTTGEVKLWGRVGSLLEVGTGFHPDLTGRENIFLNGAILGMTKAEIRKNFDEIVAFSECETFIDTPVKRYSSGMYVRLAFAVAAHLEPEILIVDEVLAVGDAPFQKKCLGKMKDVSQHGRTVLFVSHQMSAISALCDRAVLLRDGRLAAMDVTSRIVAAYQADSPAAKHSGFTVAEMPRTGSGKARFTSFRMTVTDRQGRRLENVVPGSDVTFEGHMEGQVAVSGANVAVIIYDLHGYRLVDVNTALHGEFLSLKAGQSATVRFVLKDLRLKPGDYSVTAYIGRAQIEEIDHVQGAITLQVFDPVSAKHSEAFPGVYQCDFTHTLVVHDRSER